MPAQSPSIFQIAFGSRERKSPFFQSTVDAGVTHFTIYNHMFMPVSYGDTMAEYDRLINGVAIWDVAAERQVQLVGKDALKLAQYLTPRKLGNFSVGQGKYVPICDHDGRLVNDPILMKLADDKYWLSIADQDLKYVAHAIAAEKGWNVEVSEPDVSPLAVQGPKAEQLVADLFGDWIKDIKYFWFAEAELNGIPLILMRSGWSKQGGFELFLQDGSRGDELWQAVVAAGEKYDIGPGAPNYIERVESGLLSFGADTVTDSDPFEVGLGGLVNLDRDDDFVGKAALIQRQQNGTKRRLMGVKFDGEPVAPNAHPWSVKSDNGNVVGRAGAVAYSPRVKSNIGMVLIDSAYANVGDTVLLCDAEQNAEQSYRGHLCELPLI